MNLPATDPLSNGVNSRIVAAEWFWSPACSTGFSTPASCVVDPGQGSATAIGGFVAGTSVTLSNVHLTIPSPRTGRVVSVRVQDAAGNWSALVNFRLTN